MQSLPKITILLMFLVPCIASATTWYVRADGGTRFDSARISSGMSGQCNGKSDAPYPGSGQNRACAFNDFRFLYDDQTYGNSAWVIAGGDTVIVRSCVSVDGTPGCRIGYNQGQSRVDPWCAGGGGQEYCVAPPLPSGSPTNPTQILGQNYASCSADSDKTLLHGGWDLYEIFSLVGSSNVQIQCFEMTGFSSCRTAGDPPLPGDPPAAGFCSNDLPWQDNLQAAIVTNSSTASNGPVSLQDLYMHRLTNRGVWGPIGGTINALRVHIAYTGQTGWDFDDGSGTHSTNGIFNLSNSVIEWSGCQEEYPDVHNVPALLCEDDQHGVVADGIGTPDTPLIANIDHTIVRYNTQDGIDLGHIDAFSGGPATVTYTADYSYGNEGQQLKWGGVTSAIVRDSVAVADCDRMLSQIGDEPDPKTHIGDTCRAAGDTLSFNNVPGGVTTLQNNTFYGYTTELMLWGCWNAGSSGGASCNPPSSLSLVLENNIFLGFKNPAFSANPGVPPNLISFQGGTGGKYVTEDHNLSFGLKGTGCLSGAGDLCADPQLGGGSAFLSEAQFDNYNFGLTAGSPAIGAGVSIPGLTTDYAGTAWGVPPSIGALESGSASAPPGHIVIQGVINVQAGTWKDF